MIYQIDSNIWFDAEKLNIIVGQENYTEYQIKQKDYPEAKQPREKKNDIIGIVFLSSTACNLNCVYCYAGQGTYNGVSEKNTLTTQNYIKTYETMRKLHKSIKTITFFGGEPLLGFKEIKKFVEYLHDNYKKEDIPHLSIGSNGTIMNEEIKNFIREYNIDFGSSLDGPKCINDIYRKGVGIDSVYEKVIDTLDILSDVQNKKAIQFTFNRTHLENYQSGDSVKWAKAFEKLPITWYEITPVSTDDPSTQINLCDEKIKENFTLLCNELADHCLNCLITHETTIMPNIFITLFLLIAKRQKTLSCSAGKGIVTVSPDLRVYPCHMVANNREKSVALSDEYLRDAAENTFFHEMNKLERNSFVECTKCPAYNLCGVFCKGMALDNKKIQDERCYMMILFLKKVICFMAEEYKKYPEDIKSSILMINKLHQLR